MKKLSVVIKGMVTRDRGVKGLSVASQFMANSYK